MYNNFDQEEFDRYWGNYPDDPDFSDCDGEDK